LSERKISRLEICEYNQDYVPERVAIKYAKKAVAANNRNSGFIDDNEAPVKLTGYEQVRKREARPFRLM